MTINSSYSDYSNQSNYSIPSDGRQSKEGSFDQLFREERDKILSDPNLSSKEKGQALLELLKKTSADMEKKIDETSPSSPEFRTLQNDYELLMKDFKETMDMDIVRDAIKDAVMDGGGIKRQETSKPRGPMDLAGGR